MDNAMEKQKKRTELNDGDRKVLYKYVTLYSDQYGPLKNLEGYSAFNNSIRDNTNKQY